MINFKAFYSYLNNTDTDEEIKNYDFFDSSHLDCLLHPVEYNESLQVKETDICFRIDTNGEEKTIGVCDDHPHNAEALAKANKNKDIIATLDAIKNPATPTYALLAPAFVKQFEGASTGKLRSCLKALGFDGVIEVALFADILTLKEAIEFDRNVKSESDYQITSCCCPMWIGMLRKYAKGTTTENEDKKDTTLYNHLFPHIPPSVSPMIASGRVIKKLHRDAKTIFIGPCIAKKAEAKEKDIADAVDVVLTFTELQEIFDTFKINPNDYPSSKKSHSSYAGRIYAKATGVSEAVKSTLYRLNPTRKIGIKAQKANGVVGIRDMLNDIVTGNITANFFEGMGCKGGCVGGPRACLPVEEGSENVQQYADDAKFKTPLDNLYILELLSKIGIKTDEDLLKSPLFVRRFE